MTTSGTVIADHSRTAAIIIADGVTPATRAAAMCCAGCCGASSGRQTAGRRHPDRRRTG
jgi:hypothetical protein